MPLPLVTVRIAQTNRHTLTDSAGRFAFANLAARKYTLNITASGYHVASKNLYLLIGVSTSLTIRLKTAVNELSTVSVTGKSNAALVREQPQNLTVIDTKPYFNRPEGAISLINRAAGVKVRQSGGLGSNANFYLNGLSGKQVKFFIDGIPLDYLGAGLNFNILPVNVIDRIEIYKGVVPISLGADALGGAIDIISRRNKADYLDAAYTISSSNTHRASLNLRKNISRNWYAEGTGFYNASDNNYKIDVEIPNANGNIERATVRRFHDRFGNTYGRLAVGLQDQKWADDLSIFSAISNTHQQLQNNLLMTQPYAHVTYNEEAWNNGLRYAKSTNRWGIRLYAGVNYITGHFIDTSLNTYNWYGQAVARRNSGGESFGPAIDLVTKRTQQLARLNAYYQLNTRAKLEAAVLGARYIQRENNPATAAYPVNLGQWIAGLALNYEFPAHHITSITSVKYYNYNNQGYAVNSGGDYSTAFAQKSRLGWNEALRWAITSKISAKASYELATRLPDQSELFGQYQQLTRPNPNLNPETSHNINGGLQYTSLTTQASVNTFYRLADHIIYAPPSAFYLLYQNLLKAQFSGIEADYSLKFAKGFVLNLNGTYQHIISRSGAIQSGVTDDSYYGQRLPNIPFLFGNGELMWNRDGAFGKYNRFSAWFGSSYVHWYYLYWAKDGDAASKAIIPTQWVHRAGISYTLKRNRYAISLESQNLTDAKVYDNYRAQLPGRSFHLKFRTYFQ